MIPLKIEVPGAQAVSALLSKPPQPSACVVLAHGAGAGMNHPFMSAVTEGLADRSIATLRYQFPFTENGRRRPDAPPLAQATVRAAVTEAGRQLPSLPLFAGGKSFGGRMTSQAQAAETLPNVSGLIFLGFPLHAAGKPSVQRADHLSSVAVPMLFLQGSRDALADRALIEGTVARLGASATLKVIDGADHSFHVPVRSGRTDAQVITGLLDTLSAWLLDIVGMGNA